MRVYVRTTAQVTGTSTIVPQPHLYVCVRTVKICTSVVDVHTLYGWKHKQTKVNRSRSLMSTLTLFLPEVITLYT